MTDGTPSTGRSWTVRPYREGDEAEILRLFTAGGFSPQSEQHFRWRVLTVPCPVPTVWVAEDRGRIIGTYGGTPVRFRINGLPTPAIHGCDAMTDHEYRRQGILTVLASTAANSWASAGFRLQIGVPWGSWGSRRAVLGWIPLFPLVWLRRWLRPERVLARHASLPSVIQQALASARPWDRLTSLSAARPASDVEVRELAEPCQALDRLWTNTEGAWDNVAVRDRDLLAWRYFSAPDLVYRVLIAERQSEIVGYLAFRIERGEQGGVRALIADMLASPGESEGRYALLSAMMRRFRAENVESVMALVIDGSPMCRELEAAGFSKGPGNDFFIVPFDPSLPLDDLRAPERWHLMGGDFDVM